MKCTLPKAYLETRIGRFVNSEDFSPEDDLIVRDGHLPPGRHEHYPIQQKDFMGNGRFLTEGLANRIIRVINDITDGKGADLPECMDILNEMTK